MKILVLSSWFPVNCNDINGSFFLEQLLAYSNHYKEDNLDVISVQLKSIKLLKKARLIKYRKKSLAVQIFQYPCIPKLKTLNHTTYAYITKKIINKFIKEKYTPDLIYVQGLYPSIYISAWAHKKWGIPFIAHAHSSFVHKRLYDKKTKQRLSKALAQAKAVIAVSSSLASALKSLTNKKCIVLPNPLGELFLSDNIEHRYYNRKQFVIASIGNLIPQKGMKLLIDAFVIAYSKKQDLKLVIVGDGEQKEELFSYCINQKLEKNIELMGKLTRLEVKTLLSTQVDLLVSTSESETFGMSIIESLSCGVPVIATNSGGVRDTISEEYGYICETRRADDIAYLMLKIIDNKKEWQKNAEKIKAKARTQFSPTKFSEKLRSILMR